MPTRGGIHGGTKRPQGGSLTRFVGHSSHGVRNGAALRADHAAITEGRSLFPGSVVDAGKSPRLLISGHNNAKIGAKITKGPWAGMPVFALALEERATCPTTCYLWRECYGNAMPFARRHRDDGQLLSRLWQELQAHAWHYQGRFAVRLHVLGDFPSVAYTLRWASFLRDLPQLHVWGYTAHPRDSEIGRLIQRMNERFPDRFVVRFSAPPDAVHQPYAATTIWRKPETDVVPEGQVCPVSTAKARACGTCGLCWSQEMRDTPIVFVGHGMRRKGATNG